MKPKEYITKYHLNEADTNFSHNSMISDFTIDFMTMIDFHKTRIWNYTIFQNCVNQIRDKWDSINVKAVTKLPDKLWNFFYASVIVKVRDTEFADYLAAKERKYNDYKRKKQERDNLFNHYFADFMSQLLFDILVPSTDFNLLGLDPLTSSVEDVKFAYRKLSLTKHPDKGGSSSEFIRLTEAKNRVLHYLASVKK